MDHYDEDRHEDEKEDWVALAVDGRLRFAVLFEAERRAAVAELAAQGMTRGGVADRLQASTEAIGPYWPED